MTKIGIYDSGIGGLTTTARILKQFGGNDIYYLADNKNMPFGSKNEDDLSDIVFNGIRKLRANSDICVIACNTASSAINDEDVIKLLPPKIENCDSQALLMATPYTLSKIDSNGYLIADSSELATLIEIHAALNFRMRRDLNMGDIKCYLAQRLFKFKGVKTVILGCSHYPYCKKEIQAVLGNVSFCDGNENLCNNLASFVSKTELASKVDFAFTGCDESKKYRYILNKLLLQ